tara:strand:+ start:151 stop:507 length:357 start_codon:yes stop_codon:yes gene_type:complete
MKSIHNMTKTELINYIESQKNNQTVGFANPFEDGNLQVKLAFTPERLLSMAEQVEDGWCHISAQFIPNSNPSTGWHVAESFVETFQEANARKEASDKDNGFRYKPFMGKPNEQSSEAS